ncbi:hypothetical protein BKA56DRAFT_113771 [Ilyonectria sp. MPI-CAGE-AT-0026]|nr:hypothetical protein BKA56DRAFT_113771 [Ilyonectria sp. MPI-CAGE-AT-0026]
MLWIQPQSGRQVGFTALQSLWQDNLEQLYEGSSAHLQRQVQSEKTGVPCIQKSSNSCCDSCDTLGYECANFSHEDHVRLNDFKVCHRCENDIPWTYFDRHQRNCPGKCDQRTSSSIPCVRTRFGHDKKQGCESCTSKGFECTGASHADALDTMEKPCRHCGTSLRTPTPMARDPLQRQVPSLPRPQRASHSLARRKGEVRQMHSRSRRVRQTMAQG